MAEDVIWLDGGIVSPDEAAVSLRDPGFQFGEGLFETLRVHRGHPFQLGLHLERLARGARRLDLDPSRKAFTRGVQAVVAGRGDEDFVLKMLLWRRADETSGTAVLTRSLPANMDRWAREGVRLLTSPVRQSTSDLLPRLKSLNYLSRARIRRWAQARNAYDALLLNDADWVAEGTATAVAWVSDGALVHPAAEANILPSISMKTLVDLALEAGIPVEGGLHPREALDEADEVLVSNSVVGPLPVRELDDRTYDAPGPITRRLQTAYEGELKNRG